MKSPSRVLLVDLETGGLDPSVDPVVEVAGVVYDVGNACVSRAFSTLVHSETNDAEHINGIAPSSLVDAPSFAEAVEQLFAEAEHAEMYVAHNAPFDRSFMPGYFADARPWADTRVVEWSPRHLIGKSLVHVAISHGIGVSAAHRALDDVLLLARIFTRCAERGLDVGRMLADAAEPRVHIQALVTYEQRHLAKENGFRWDAKVKAWVRWMREAEREVMPFGTAKLDA